ncbi:hypothetical protein ILYODFUR_032061 [Ilyodon furcidens]|uniref:Uncharacterized protein n=1 Tax=Ilyodon furcidens TaxID=33524 RepID=A0ABV0TGN4_9TELE
MYFSDFYSLTPFFILSTFYFMFLHSNEGAEFICRAALGQQGRAQFVAVPEDSMPELLRQCHHIMEESPGARLAVDACHCGCRCFCGSRLCNKFSLSFQKARHTHT